MAFSTLGLLTSSRRNFCSKSYHHIIISLYHHVIIIIPSYPYFIISSYQHTTISSYHHIIIWQDEKSTCHFFVNSADRPGIWSNCNQIRLNPGTNRPNSPKNGMQNFRTSNGSTIARIAPISTIGGKRSRRPDLFFRKFPRHRKLFRVIIVVIVVVAVVVSWVVWGTR